MLTHYYTASNQAEGKHGVVKFGIAVSTGDLDDVYSGDLIATRTPVTRILL